MSLIEQVKNLNSTGWGADHAMLMAEALDEGEPVYNQRTKQHIYTLHTQSLQVDLQGGYLPLTGLRRMYPGTAAAEVAWFITGEPTTQFLTKHTSIWDNFLEDLAPIGRPGEKGLNAAYGYRWRNHFKLDQLQTAIDRLLDDPSSRQIWISSWDPNTDLLGTKFSSNVPCPVGFTLKVNKGRLDSLYVLRSSDLGVGLPYDVMCHSFLIAILSATLGVTPGIIHIAISDAHVYQSQKADFISCLGHLRENNLGLSPVSIKLPSQFTLENVTKHPDEYVEYIKENTRSEQFREYQNRLKQVKPIVHI